MNPLSVLTSWFLPTPQPVWVEAGLTRITQLIDTPISTGKGFKHKLSGPVEHALTYCGELVDALPPPVTVDRARFASDPKVHALFGSAADIDAMLGRSHELEAFLGQTATLGVDRFCALLATRRREKQIIGSSQNGTGVQSDVAQRMLYFSDHTLTLFAIDPGTAKAQLYAAAFDSLLRSFAAHVAAVRAEQGDLRQSRELEKIRIQVSRNHMPADWTESHIRYLAGLDDRLRSNAEALLPNALVEALADFLSDPGEALRLERFTLSVDRRGTLARADLTPAGEVSELEFAELVSRDRRKHVVLPVEIWREDAVHAIAHLQDTRAKGMLI